MDPKFSVIFLAEAAEFLDGLDDKSRRKVIYNIDKSRYVNDPKLFKKLTKDIWEFGQVPEEPIPAFCILG